MGVMKGRFNGLITLEGKKKTMLFPQNFYTRLFQ